MGNCIRNFNKPHNPFIILNKTKTNKLNTDSKLFKEERHHILDQVFEEIKDIKDLQIKGMMLLSESIGKPRDLYDTMMNIAQLNNGNIKKVKHKISGRIRVEKLIKKELIEVKEDESLIFKELALLRTLDHPNIIKLYEFYRDERFYYLISDFCEEGELFKLIKKEPNGLPEITVAHIMNQLLSVVNYCHQAHNVVNRDYRLENILVDSVEYKYINNQNVPLFSIKVSEFKSARSFKNSKMLNKKVGNPYYIAPEVLKRKYNEKCDLWSCGIILYILLTSKPPFSGTTDKEVLDKVQSGVFDYFDTDLANNSNECKSLLKELFRLDPHKRPSAAIALKHDWFKKNKIESYLNMRFVYECFNNFLKFSPELKFQQATLAYMVHHLLGNDDVKDIKILFQMFDSDNDGRLSHEELVEGFREHLSFLPNEKEFHKVIKKADQDKSGYIDYEEFIRACINKSKLLSDDNLRRTFRLLDKDDNKSITLQELKSLLELSTKYSDKVWIQILNEIEHKIENEVSYEEFKNMMTKLIN